MTSMGRGVQGAVGVAGASIEYMKAVRPRRLSRAFAALAALAAGTISCGGDSPVKPTGGRAPTPVVVAFGDSLTAGPGLRPEEAWPALLEQRARGAGYPHRFHNAGVSGDATSDAVRRLDGALIADARVFIVALGANDGLRGVPIATIRSNLEIIIERAQERGLRVLLCGMETPPTHGWQYSVDFHRLFPDLAARYGVPLVPFLLVGVVGNPDYNLGDRVHPNGAGMRVIADTMWPYVQPLLE